ncbi:MAG: hypothetical protein AABW46_00840 [Nanoarchaeota archaeon]
MVNLKQIAVVVAVSILSAFLIGLAIDAFYPTPKYEDYCKEYNYPRAIPEKYPGSSTNCTYQQTEGEVNCYKDGGMPEFDYDENGCSEFRECNFCNQEFQLVNAKYNRNVFFITAPIGLLLIIYGIFFAIEFIGSGFMFGGILTLAYGTIRYFSNMSKIMRVIVIFIELIIVVWLSIKKLKK